MAITNYQYADISPGLSGFFDTGSSASRISFHGYSVLALRITGTDATLKVGGGGPQPFNVSVDGAAETNPTISGGSITLFSGLSDTEHVVFIRGAGAYTPSNCWIVYATADTLVVTGSAPAMKPISFAITTWDTFPGQSSEFFVAAPGGNVTPVKPMVDSVAYGYGQAIFRGQLDTLYVMTGRTSVRYSVDGGTPVLVSLPEDVSPLKARVLATGLDGSSVHTYTIWDNQGSNTYAKLQGVAGTLNGNSVTLTPLPSTRKRVYQYGDSITEASTPGPGTMDLFQVSLNLNLSVASYGISGYTISQLTSVVPTAFSKSLVPDYALLAIGRNDAENAGQIQTDYTACIQAFLTAGCTKILCRGVLPEGANTWPVHNGAIQAAIASFSNPNIQFIDTSSWSGIATLDGVHPSAAGYQTIASYETPVLAGILAAPVSGTIAATAVTGQSSLSGTVVNPVTNVTGTIASVATGGSVSSVGTSSSNTDPVWDVIIEYGAGGTPITARQIMRAMLSVLAGETQIVTGVTPGTATVKFLSQDLQQVVVQADLSESVRSNVILGS